MSDYVSFGPSDGRAQAVHGDPIVRDDPAEPPIAFNPTPSHLRRRPWSRLRVVGAVVAAASVAGAIASALGPAADNGRGSIPAAASAAPAAADGWRWDSYQGVRVQVPSNWAYALEPVQDWCRGDSAYLPRHPYVSLGATRQSVAGAGCRNANGDVAVQPPTRLWAAHVALDPATDLALPRTTRRNGWWVVRRPIGDVVVKAVSHDRTIADRIAASAEMIDD